MDWTQFISVLPFLSLSLSIFASAKAAVTFSLGRCEVSRVRAMLLISVAYIFFTTRPTILLLVYLPLNSITNTKTVM